MSQQGFNVPTAAADSGTEWAGETNVYLSDASYATQVAASTDFLLVTDFDFEIDYNTMVAGIEVSIEGNGSGTGADAQVEVSLTKDGTTLVGAAKTAQQLGESGTDAVIKIGGPLDLWSAVFDIDEVNASTFGVRIKKTNSNGTISIDQVRVRIHTMEGIRGEWDLHFDNQRVTHKSGWVDYDAGSGGTLPVIGDVIYDSTSGAVSRILRLSNSSVLAFGEFTLGEQHEDVVGDGDTLVVTSYVDFDTESNGGPNELHVGGALTGGTLSGAVVRHVVSDGSVGRIWFTTSSGSLADTNAISVDGTQVALADGASVDNAWTATADGAQVETVQGYLDYDDEQTKFESVSGSERIKSQGFRHNMCILDTTSDATAMLVDDVEDQADSTKGRFFMIDIQGTFGNNNTVIALEELDFDTESNGGFSVGDRVDNLATTKQWHVRRIIDNGDGTGTLYLENNSGVAFVDDEDLYVSASQKGIANGAQRVRVGEATIDGTITEVDVSWLNSHVYTDTLSRMRPLLSLDDTDPMKGRVLDQQYELLNDWLIPFYSTRRIKKGALNVYDTIGGTVGDTVMTNFNHLGGLNQVANIYGQQDGEYVEQFWGAGSEAFDILLRNKLKNAKIDEGRITFYCRPFNDEYDFALLGKIGLANPVGINTKADGNNETTYATIRDDVGYVYHKIIVGWASHTLEFDGGSGTLSVGDVIYNATRDASAMVVRVPDSLVSGTDMHLAAHGQDLSDWADGDALVVCDYFDFDDQDSQFVVGDEIENTGDTFNATVAFVQQFGGVCGRVWYHTATGTVSDNDDIKLNGAGAERATARSDTISGGTWTGDVHTSDTTADNTVLLDIGQGGDQPYNAHWMLDGATVAQFYEFAKFVVEERAGDPTVDPGSVMYPNDTAVQGRFYQKADSAYGAADTIKTAPMGTKAGTLFQGAAGQFISDMAAADAQNYALIDANLVPRTPPNFQNVSATGGQVGASLSIYRRFQTLPSGTVDFTNATGVIHIDSGGSFEGLEVGALLTVTGTTLNNDTFTVQEVTDNSNIVVVESLTDESNVSDVSMIGNNVNRQRYTGTATGNDLGDPDFVVDAAIASDEPSNGFIVIQHINGTEIYEDLYTVTSWTGSTFTVTPNLVRNYDANAIVRMPLILKFVTSDPETQQIIYSADFAIKTKYREEGYDAFTQDSIFGATGATVALGRAPDNVAE